MVQGDAAQVHVVVRFFAGGQSHFAVHYSKFLYQFN